MESRIAFAVAPTLVADINQIPDSGLDPTTAFAGFGPTSNGLVFLGSDPDHGQELWVTNGTAAGTKLLRDVNVGPGSVELEGSSPLYNGAFYFLPFTGNGTELWKTDGTEAGTMPVAMLSDQGSGGGGFVTFAGKLYFVAADSIWETDGTEAGTTQVAMGDGEATSAVLFVLGNTLFALVGSPDGSALFSKAADGDPELVATLPGVDTDGAFSRSAVVGSKFLFPASEDGFEALWVTDGTDAGTGPVFPDGDGPSTISAFVVFGNAAYFSAEDDVNGNELWRSDGTLAGTRLVRNINAGVDGSFPSGFAALGSKLFFTAGTATNGAELWVTDGTFGGTRLFADLQPGSFAGEALSSSPNALKVLGTQLYFAANGNKLWKTDGTAAPTLVKDCYPGEDLPSSAGFGAMAVFNGRLYFAADDGTRGIELWSSDGTPSGTSLLKDVAPGTGDGVDAGSASYLAGAALNGAFLFAADDGLGYHLYKRNTLGIVSLVKDLDVIYASPEEFEFTGVNGAVYFGRRDDAGNRELWKTDGSTAGTFRIGTVTSGRDEPFGLTAFAGSTFFCADSPQGRGIYRTNGTASEPTLVADGYDAANFAVFGGRLFFVNRDPEFGTSDVYVMATPSSEPELADFDDGSLFADASDLKPLGGKLYFTATDLDSESLVRRLFVTDGTAFGTAVVATAGGVFPESPGALTPAGTSLFFTATSAATGLELWRTQTVGGVERAVLVKDVTPGIADSFLGNLVAYGNGLFFLNYDLDTGRSKLWQSDGTSSGTKEVVLSGARQPEIAALSPPVGDRMYVAARDQTTGLELWSLWLEAPATPAAPTGLAGTPGNGQVNLTWTAPVSNGGPAINDYVIRYSADNGATWLTYSDLVSTATTATVKGLANGTAYLFRVAATNSAGLGAFSADSAPVTPRTTPGIPTAVIGARGNGLVDLSWTAPTSTGGSPITDYVVQFSANNGVSWTTFADAVSPATKATVTGLKNGTAYVFRVAAKNLAGTGGSSTNSAPVTPRPVPGVPTNVVGTADNGRVRLTWTAPTSNGGSAITDYVVQYSANNGLTWVTFADPVSAATSATVSGLTNGTAYLFRVAAKNVGGAGGYSANSALVTPRTIPGAPTGLAGVVGNGQVRLTWAAPASNGGAAVTDYAVQYSVNNGSTWTTFADPVSTDTSATVTGLTNGRAYVFRVAAKNAAGLGPYTAKTSALTPRLA